MNLINSKEFGKPKINHRDEEKRSPAEWLIPAGLILLSTVPMLAGAARMTQLIGGAEITADNARFFASPLPVILHIISVTLYSLLGAFQFAPGFRRRNPVWHRSVGRVLIPAGGVAALSGLWMAQFYPWPQYDGVWLYGLRLLFGTAMLISLVLGYLTARQWNFAQHETWMIRAYAIGLGAGTQVFTHIPWALFPSIHGELARTIMMGAGWMINLAVAEWIIQKRFSSQHVSNRK
ncbi:MAG: DUF2306 domain-containing protein [Anaerolineales bacterium]|nr:DUF2306 domain-containing protein [Anaerolineales bacterium]